VESNESGDGKGLEQTEHEPYIFPIEKSMCSDLATYTTRRRSRSRRSAMYSTAVWAILL
jgi:hypothetical protein